MPKISQIDEVPCQAEVRILQKITLKFPKVSINRLKLLQDALKATSDRNGSDSDLSTRRSPFINNKSCKVTSLTSSVTRKEDSQWTQESIDCFSAQNSIASTEDCKTPVVSSVSLERDVSVLTHKTLPCAGGVIEMSLIENSGFQTKSHELSESQLKLKNCCEQDINETDVGDAVKSSEGRPLIDSDTEAVVCAPVDPFETFIFRYNGEATFRDQGAGDRERIRFEEGEKEVAFLVEKENPDVVTEMVPCSRINSQANLSSRGFVPEARYPGENTAAVTVSRMCPNSWDACECDTAVQQCELNADLKSDVSAKELSLKTGSLGDCSEVEGSDEKWHTFESCILDSNVSMKSSSFSREIARRELFGDFLKSDMAVKHNKRLEYSTDSILETSHSRFLEASKAGLAIVTETSVANQTVTVKACAQLLSGSTKRENCCSEKPRTVGVMETTKNPFHGADGNSEFKVKEWSSGEKGCSQSMEGEVMSPVQEQDHERKFFQITDRVSSNKSLLIEQNYILNENGSRIKHPTVDVPSSSQCITMVEVNVTYDKASEHMESVIYSEDVPCLEQEERRDILPNLAGKEKGCPTERPSSTKEKEQEIQFGSGEENDCFERPTLVNEPKKSGSCSLIESVTVVRSTISEASANICLTTTINWPEQPTKTEVSQNVTGFRSASLSKSEKLSLKATKGSTKLVAKESRPQEQTVKTVYSQGGQAPEGSWPSDQTVSLEESQNFLGARIGSSVKTQNSCVHSLKGLKASKDSNPGRTVNEVGPIQTDGVNDSTISETEQKSKRSANCNAEATRNSKYSANASMTTSFQPSSKASSPSERDEGHFNQEKGLISDSNVICGDQHKTSPLPQLMHLSLDSRTQNMLSKQCVDDMFYMMTKRQKMMPPPPLLSLDMRLKGCQEVHEDSMEDQRLHIPYPSRDRLNGQLPRVKHERKCTRISGKQQRYPFWVAPLPQTLLENNRRRESLSRLIPAERWCLQRPQETKTRQQRLGQVCPSLRDRGRTTHVPISCRSRAILSPPPPLIPGLWALPGNSCHLPYSYRTKYGMSSESPSLD